MLPIPLHHSENSVFHSFFCEIQSCVAPPHTTPPNLHLAADTSGPFPILSPALDLFAYAPPQYKFVCWNPVSRVMVSGGGTFGRWLDREGGAFMVGISTIEKETQRASLPPPPCEDTVRRQPSLCKIGIKPYAWHQICQSLDLRLPSLQTDKKDRYVVYATSSAVLHYSSPNGLQLRHTLIFRSYSCYRISPRWNFGEDLLSMTWVPLFLQPLNLFIFFFFFFSCKVQGSQTCFTVEESLIVKCSLGNNIG